MAVSIKLRKAIQDACQDTLGNFDNVSVDGLLGITVNQSDVFLVKIEQTIFDSQKQYQDEGLSSPPRKRKRGKSTKNNGVQLPTPVKTTLGETEFSETIEMKIKSDTEEMCGLGDEMPEGIEGSAVIKKETLETGEADESWSNLASSVDSNVPLEESPQGSDAVADNQLEQLAMQLQTGDDQQTTPNNRRKVSVFFIELGSLSVILIYRVRRDVVFIVELSLILAYFKLSLEQNI